MIRVNELRIGNWVSYNTCPNKIISILSPEDHKDPYWNGKWCVEIHPDDPFDLRLEDIRPIPLAPEILKKCGFRKRDGYPYKMAHGYLKMRNGVFFFKYYDIEIEVTHFHQLQNLYFALTGEELNIKL